MNYEHMIDEASRRINNSLIDAKIKGVRDLADLLTEAFTEADVQNLRLDVVLDVIRMAADKAEIRHLRQKK